MNLDAHRFFILQILIFSHFCCCFWCVSSPLLVAAVNKYMSSHSITHKHDDNIKIRIKSREEACVSLDEIVKLSQRKYECISSKNFGL